MEEQEEEDKEEEEQEQEEDVVEVGKEDGEEEEGKEEEEEEEEEEGPLAYKVLVYTTQVNSTFRPRWLASSEVISQVLFTSKQLKKKRMAFVIILSQIKLLFGPLVIQLVWYILKQLFTSVSVKVVYIYLHFGK